MAEPADFFAGHPDGLAAFARVHDVVDRLGDAEVRVSRVARRGLSPGITRAGGGPGTHAPGDPCGSPGPCAAGD